MRKNLKRKQGEQRVLKQVYNFFIAAVLICFLSINPIAFAVEDTDSVTKEISQNNDIELIHNDIHVEDSNISPMSTGTIKESVVPDPSKEGKKVFGLFLKTMVAVGFSVILLYFILLFVKRYYSNVFNNESEELEDLDLSTPNNKNDALKSFLNRTR